MCATTAYGPTQANVTRKFQVRGLFVANETPEASEPSGGPCEGRPTRGEPIFSKVLVVTTLAGCAAFLPRKADAISFGPHGSYET